MKKILNSCVVFKNQLDYSSNVLEEQKTLLTPLCGGSSPSLLTAVVDFHVHTFPEKIAASALEKLQAKSHTRPFTDGTLSALELSMKESGVSFSILQPVATSPKQVSSINDKAIKQLEMRNEKLEIKNNSALRIPNSELKIISFGAMHPEFENFEFELERIARADIKGIKLHPVYQNLNIDDEKFIKILSCACDFNLAVLIHAGWDIGFPGNDFAMPERIYKALKKIKNPKKIILAHMGGWRAWDEAEKFFADFDGVFIDTAFSLGSFTPNGDNFYKNSSECEMLSPEKFTKIIKSFGASRVLFGTDSPWSSQKDSVESFKALENLSDEEKNLILFQNAAFILAF
ncbi:MAG: amidohydrolase family protein [Synergistaceae bacterium]|nr:amidohydrolase family protein [Synergistaceae bacterium]